MIAGLRSAFRGLTSSLEVRSGRGSTRQLKALEADGPESTPSRRTGAWLGRAVVAVLVGAVSVPADYAQAQHRPDSFADLAAKLLPAVVNISTTQTIKGNKGAPPQEMPQFPPGSPLEDLFKDFMNRNRGGGGDQPPRRAQSLGSGFIVDPSGLVVTNNHVIADADEITVTLQDNTNLKAEVVGRDTKVDLALLRVKPAKPLAFVKFGDSDKTRVGDWVLAIGNPFGLGGTVTAGILSARGRDISAGQYDDFLQTDASINRGNSGGPMFNMDGEVIGVNTAIYSPTGGSIGIGFAIPANMARPVIEQIKEFGRPRRGWLGVRIQSVTDEIAESLGLDKPRGALIASVNDGGPAQKGGIQPGDVVLSFDGKEITDVRQLPRIVAETPIDKTVKVTVWRKRKEETVDVKVGLLDENEPQQASAPAGASEPPVTVKALGLSLSTITPDLRTKFSLADDAAGVVVVDVQNNSPAAEKAVKAGDVIVEVAQEEVKSPAQVADKVEEAKKAGRKSVLMLIDRQGELGWKALRIDGKG
ncbi:MAG TPA: DegQ family serine endoprotease [Stellaceae bacterium]|nr:DegQ family serine endoprotease [Stellaceae bacterium]